MFENKNITSLYEGTPVFPFYTIKEYLKSALINTSKDVPEPPVAATINSKGSDITLATLGDFSLWIGKSKSKKTFLITALMAAHTGETILNITGKLPADKKIAILFDTEQSLYHAHKTANRVILLIKSNVPTFKAYSLRKHEPSVRLSMIEYCLYNTPNIGIVAIDGIRDLIRDINSLDEASMISSKLLKWTEELNIHIICVLHMNKGDSNARGHLGTELINKAQNVISVSKLDADSEISIVNNVCSREIEFEPFAFYINEDGLPELLSDYSIQKPQKRTTPIPFDFKSLDLAQHKQILNLTFKGETQLSYSQLWKKIKVAFEYTGTKISDNKAKDILAYYSQLNEISAVGIHGTSNAKYILKPPA